MDRVFDQQLTTKRSVIHAFLDIVLWSGPFVLIGLVQHLRYNSKFVAGWDATPPRLLSLTPRF